jgi:anti-anti-sigma factor
MGTERFKGSHSMSAYHSTELCYLSAVYSNLLVTKQPLELHFKPKPGAFGDNILRVSPDILPEGSIRIEEVWIDGARWTDFDPHKLTVTLPTTDVDLRVRVRLVPAVLADSFTAEAECVGDSATLTLVGTLDRASLGQLQHELATITAAQPKKVLLDVTDLQTISGEGMRALVFAKQKLAIDVDMLVVGATGEVRQAFDDEELSDEVTFASTVPDGTR